MFQIRQSLRVGQAEVALTSWPGPCAGLGVCWMVGTVPRVSGSLSHPCPQPAGLLSTGTPHSGKRQPGPRIHQAFLNLWKERVQLATPDWGQGQVPSCRLKVLLCWSWVQVPNRTLLGIPPHAVAASAAPDEAITVRPSRQCLALAVPGMWASVAAQAALCVEAASGTLSRGLSAPDVAPGSLGSPTAPLGFSALRPLPAYAVSLSSPGFLFLLS